MKMKVQLALAMWAVAVAAAERPQLTHVESFLEQSSYQVRKKYRPLYHVSAPFGWINDPAALVHYRDQFHLFYQYYPYVGTWAPLHWGHAVSDNLVDWAHYPPALMPREPYDRHGCLAGSVAVRGRNLALFYTGELLLANRTRQTQNLAVSTDGILFQKYFYNPIVSTPPDGVSDYRNPKVWKFQKTWYMLIGASVEGRGRLALHTSQDLYKWTYNGTVAESAGDLGYLWESPDVFEIDGLGALVLSARGVRADGDRFRNLHQTGYVLGRFHYRPARFADLEVSTATFTELDYGHDFYAAKTVRSKDGRRLLIAWLGMWQSEFLESKEGWAGAMTLVREVRMGRGGRLVTPPAREALRLRAEMLENAWYEPGEAFSAGVRSFELVVNASSAQRDVALSLEWRARAGPARYTVTYSAGAHCVCVDRGGPDGERRADWAPEPAAALHLRIFVDRGSVEVFVGEGEVVFSSRVHPSRDVAVRVGGAARLHLVQHRLRRSVGFDRRLRNYLRDHLLNKSTSSQKKLM